eukprot:TRINITY_DN72_c0_g1_i1.p2 TRINITY_DN72_c0_g1~~TRINITY_DN72_c0_g1_i1.p2  ORF type:complete len:136 (-),score=29.80 TRINITY_DN72_c0_g1_i1:1095-1502(-)
MRSNLVPLLVWCGCGAAAFVLVPPSTHFVRAMRHAGGGDIELAKALDNARRNLEEGKSPGAGLATAEEQADAAYADLILTSVDQKVSHKLLLLLLLVLVLRHMHACAPDLPANVVWVARVPGRILLLLTRVPTTC